MFPGQSKFYELYIAQPLIKRCGPPKIVINEWIEKAHGNWLVLWT